MARSDEAEAFSHAFGVLLPTLYHSLDNGCFPPLLLSIEKEVA